MKRTAIIIMFICIFSVGVRAEGFTPEKFIEEQAEIIGTEDLESALPEESREYFNDREISPSKTDWADSLSLQNVFSDLWETVKSRATAPFASMGVVLAVVLLNSTLTSMELGKSHITVQFVVTAVTASVMAVPLLNVINSAVDVLQSVAVFMTAFVPIFGVIVASGGQGATSVSMSGLLLGATQVVDVVANHFVIPLMCGYLSVNIAAGVSPLMQKSALPETLKKVAFWVMSLTTTVFLGVLSIQTTISASADSLSIRTARFIVGSSVPVAGTVLSEALTTVTASLGVLKTSVAIYGVVVCCVIFLPILLEIILWRISLNLTSAVADILSANTTSRLLRSGDACLSVLSGIMLLTAALFIISLTVVVSVGKGL